MTFNETRMISGFLLMILFNLNVFAYDPIPNSPLAKNERPRIFMNSASFNMIAARAYGSHAEMYSTLKAKADELLVEEPTALFERSAILALVAAIEKANGRPYTDYRDRAFYYAQSILDNRDPWELTSASADAIQSLAGALSLVYDWLYSDLPIALKSDIHDFLVNVYKGLHNIDRPSGSGQARRSVFGSKYWLEWGAHPWFSVALYGDGEGDETIINDALDATKNEVDNYMVKALNMLGGALHSGWGYELDGDVSASFLDLLAWQSATGEVVFSDYFALKEFPKYFLYASKPDGALIKLNDTNDSYSNPEYPYGTAKWGKAHARSVLIILMDIYKDGYAKYIVDKQDFRSSGNGGDRGWRNLIFYDNTVVERLPSTLPLVRFFPQTGLLSGRSGWGPNDLFYTFRNRDQYGNHSDAKQNSFTIYHQGVPLAINDGSYPDGASGAQSTKSYYRRTISSNSVLVFDPSETFYNFAAAYNDGGQKFGDLSNGANAGYAGGWGATIYNQEEFDASEYNTADNYFEQGTSYTYIKGDATRGYTSKVKRFIREFVHIKPTYFVIFDKVGSSNKDFRKKWLLHSITEPALNGTEDFTCSAATGESACQGDTDAGISKSYDTNEAVITNRNGRLFLKTLLPANPVYRKVGGPGYVFWVDDANQDIPPKWFTDSVTGGWRLEISPQTPDDDSDGESLDFFLNVLYTSDTSINTMPNIIELSGARGNVFSSNMIGTQINDAEENKIILFNSEPSGNAVNSAINYRVETDAASRHILFGLRPNILYSINISGVEGSQINSSGQGALEFVNPSVGSHDYTIAAATTTDVETNFSSPNKFELEQNYPNPANPSTVITYSLKDRSDVTLVIYNTLGQKIKTLVDTNLPAGRFQARWDGRDGAGSPVASGIYFYRLEIDGVVITRKMLKFDPARGR